MFHTGSNPIMHITKYATYNALSDLTKPIPYEISGIAN